MSGGRRAAGRAFGRLAGGARAGDLGAHAPGRGGLCTRVLRRGVARACRGDGVTDELFDLSGRVAVVTGGLGQLGRVYTDGLVARGMRVAVFDVAADSGETGEVRHYRVDVTDRGSVEAATADVTAEWGAPHLLVNNAALDSPPDAPPEEVGPFETYPEASFDEVMDVNVKGVFLCCQAVGAGMAEAG